MSKKDKIQRIELLKFLIAEQKALEKEVAKAKKIIKPLKNIKDAN